LNRTLAYAENVLAIDGGAAVRKHPFAPWPSFGEDEIAAATEVLRSGRVNYWTGTEGREFEQEFASYVGRRHAIALANGTVALELALRVLGIGPREMRSSFRAGRLLHPPVAQLWSAQYR
jgi:dTDP-4-amino-4,6-dideoxygalactose transaminase